MGSQKVRYLLRTRPIESHLTAAWAGCSRQKKESRVSIPSEQDVRDAKAWVDDVQK